MNNKEIYEKVQNFVNENLRGRDFYSGLPEFQTFLWELGKIVGKPGEEIFKIYMDEKSKINS